MGLLITFCIKRCEKVTFRTVYYFLPFFTVYVLHRVTRATTLFGTVLLSILAVYRWFYRMFYWFLLFYVFYSFRTVSVFYIIMCFMHRT